MTRPCSILAIFFLLSGCGSPESTTTPTTTTPDAVPATSTPPAHDAVAVVTPAAPPAEELSPEILQLVAPLTTEQVRDGWINLFDGATLFGWHSNNVEVNWSVQDGTITADAGPKGLLLTTVPWADYELHCEFQMAEGGNSGIFLRTLEQPQEVTTDCYELNIVDEHPSGFLTGSFVGRQKTVESHKGSGGWKSFDVRCEGNTFQVDLDGQRVLEYTDESPGARKTGFIGLQRNEGRIAFRNIRLRPLSTHPLQNAADLAGWRVVPGSKASFTVESEAIRVQGGDGFLETEGTYGDFVLQLDAATLAPRVNSGFFFRTERGTEKAPSNGYEVQLDNSMTDGNRLTPENSGTGAIFRRAVARVVAADDQQWATITLVAAGPRLATWVNGYAVVDWVDERQPDPNPRKGLRTDPGHISLQGHDPGTSAMFRNIRIAPL